MGKIRWTEKATDDLQSVHDYIARDSSTYALRFIRSLMETATRLEKMPQCGRLVPELEGSGFREVIFQSYRVVYRIVGPGETIEILAVSHGARDLEKHLRQGWDF